MSACTHRPSVRYGTRAAFLPSFLHAHRLRIARDFPSDEHRRMSKSHERGDIHLNRLLASRHAAVAVRPRCVRRAATREAGFTLLEVMIVAAVVAVLAAVAIPSYQEHVRKSARAEAQSFLTDVASRQQQFLVDKRRYAADIASLNMSAPLSLKGRFDSPTMKVEAPAGAPPRFTITAQAIGGQAKDRCPTLTIDSTGNRGPAGCW
jgi:type IV pilus assembly protein PilE